MDGTDLEILRLLVKNPQAPFCRIAKKVGVSPWTAQNKVQKMKEAGIILCSSIIIDLSKLGYQGEAYLHITNMPGCDKATTIDGLKGIPNIFLITEIIGGFDIMAIAAVKDYQSIVNMVNTVKQLPSVEKVDTDFVTDTQFPATTKFAGQLTPKKD
jgi:Lrp/AsnC family transcriptional regulator for asnA, asnC and gidA